MATDPTTEVLRTNISQLMAERGWSLADLTRHAAASRTSFYDLFRDDKVRSPRVDTVAKAAKAFGVPISTLFAPPARRQLEATLLQLFETLPKSEQDRLVLTAEAWAAANRVQSSQAE